MGWAELPSPAPLPPNVQRSAHAVIRAVRAWAATPTLANETALRNALAEHDQQTERAW